MKLLDLVDGAVVIKPECLAIEPFEKVWLSDKTKSKKEASKILKYVWFFADYKSPYHDKPEDERHKMLVADVLRDKSFKVTKEVKACIAKYREVHTTPAMKMVEAGNIFCKKLEDYFTSVNLEDVKSPKAIADMFVSMPKIVASQKEAEKKCFEEAASGTKVRGGAKLGKFEDV